MKPLPMLATKAAPFDADDYLFEVKWDGVRALAAVEHHTWSLWGRHGVDYTARYPELAVLRRLPSGTVVTVPTMLQAPLLVARFKRGGLDLVDDADAVFADFHVFDQGPHNVPTGLPVGVLQSGLNALGKHLDVLDHNLQVRTFPFHFGGCFFLAFEFLQTLFEPGDARLKVRFLEVAFLIGVEESRQASAHVADHLRQLFGGSAAWSVWAPQAAFIFGTHALRLGQQGAHVLPDGALQKIGSTRLVAAHGLAPETVGIRAAAAIIHISTRASLTRRAAERFAVVAIAALAADEQSLQQIGGAALLLSVPPPVLGQLFRDGRKQGLVHQSRHGDGDPLLGASSVPGVGLAGRQRATAPRPQARPQRSHASLAKLSLADIRGVLEQAQHGAAVPVRSATRTQDFTLF
jgi:hypothetical protein